MAAYGVTRHGNFEGKNILEFIGDLDQRRTLTEARRKLFEARERRVHPGRHEKVLTSWNGLMLATFAEAARALSPSPGSGRGGQGVRAETYRMVAERNANFLLIRWVLASGFRRSATPWRSQGRLALLVIPTLPTRRLCCASLAMATGPSR
jgi:hypothetical protein